MTERAKSGGTANGGAANGAARGAPRARAYDPDPAAPGRGCDIPGCPHEGGYRAPKSRDSLRDYFWFCLEHVRAYNASWDFYKGMTPGQIEAHMRDDTGWQRPTWPLGQLGGAFIDQDRRCGISDRQDILGANGMRKTRQHGRACRTRHPGRTAATPGDPRA